MRDSITRQEARAGYAGGETEEDVNPFIYKERRSGIAIERAQLRSSEHVSDLSVKTDSIDVGVAEGNVSCLKRSCESVERDKRVDLHSQRKQVRAAQVLFRSGKGLMQSTFILTWFASALCLVGVFCEWRRGYERSVFVTSRVVLPLYSAGIFQWMLCGLAYEDLALLSTCGFQLALLAGFFKPYVKYNRSRPV